MQAGGVALKALLSIIARIKLHRNQGDIGRRSCVEDTFDTIKRDNLCMHRLMNQPLYFVISRRKAETGPMAEAPQQTGDLRRNAEASTGPKVRATHRTEARQDGTRVNV
jgi:hypothetical protein